jgi:hypothetical protein
MVEATRRDPPRDGAATPVAAAPSRPFMIGVGVAATVLLAIAGLLWLRFGPSILIDALAFARSCF